MSVVKEVKDDKVTFAAIDLTLAVEEIYHRVQNPDTLAFLNNKNAL